MYKMTKIRYIFSLAHETIIMQNIAPPEIPKAALKILHWWFSSKQ